MNVKKKLYDSHLCHFKKIYIFAFFGQLFLIRGASKYIFYLHMSFLFVLITYETHLFKLHLLALLALCFYLPFLKYSVNTFKIS